MVAYGLGKKLHRSNNIYIAFACGFKTRPSPSWLGWLNLDLVLTELIRGQPHFKKTSQLSH